MTQTKISPLGRHNNINAVRDLMALGVLVTHAVFVSGIEAPALFGYLTYYCVGGFFALSGFLVFGSYLRQGARPGRLRRFLAGRARRILPSYFFIVIAAALLLSLVSTLDAKEYFSSPGLYKYLAANLSFMNFLWPSLPGVFGGEAVNGSLWTMKVEWMLYLSVPVVCAICRGTRRRAATVLAAVIIFSICWRLAFLTLYDMTGRGIFEIMSRQVGGQFMYFYTGALLRIYFAAFRRHLPLMLAVAAAVCVLTNNIYLLRVSLGPVFFSILVIAVSFAGRWGRFASADNNVSYQVYLFHMPLLWLLKQWGAFELLGTAGACIAGIILSWALALAFWFAVDKRIMARGGK